MKNKIPRFLKYLFVLSFLMISIALLMVFYYAPVERNMGLVQKVFYFHVAYAWIGMLSFVVAAIAGLFFLVRHKAIADGITESAVEIGLVFTLIAVASGSIWAKPAWNAWWTWDPRLTTTSIMALIYIGYIFLRNSIENQDSKRKITAFYAIIGCLSVPLTFFSIRATRSIHPVLIGSNNSGMNMTQEMFQTMIVSIAAFSVFFIALMWFRLILYRLCELSNLMKESIEE